jgi:hypothetical protein
MGERPKDKTLDRLKVNEGYHKDNCRWATHEEQVGNRRCSVITPLIMWRATHLRYIYPDLSTRTLAKLLSEELSINEETARECYKGRSYG